MGLATVFTRALAGIHAPQVSVEVHLSNGLPSLSIVGLPETAVRESKDRVRSAIQNARFEFPARRITVNLAPADLPKDGGRFDLPIALGILSAAGQVAENLLSRHEFVGELGLGGELRPVRGVLPTAIACTRDGRALILPCLGAEEATLASGAAILPAGHLLEVCAHLNGQQALRAHPPILADHPRSKASAEPDLAEVRGQHHAKRALIVAAAGRHNLLMVGPPGTGKTMLARRLAGLLPPMNQDEAIETAAIASVSGRDFDPGRWRTRPFRAPHHTASGVALVGGGSHPRPGEISLAHNGVLFLDELAEFDRRVLEVLREPLETGHITISRAARQAEYPARFQLIAAMNPCPQGYDCDFADHCRCTPEQQRRHRSRISAPLLDRIDLQVYVPRVPRAALRAGSPPDPITSAQAQVRIEQAHRTQLTRQGKINALLGNREVEQFCALRPAEETLLDRAMERLHLSARAYHRILKVARTIADLEGDTDLAAPHLTEALSYRALNRLSDTA